MISTLVYLEYYLTRREYININYSTGNLSNLSWKFIYDSRSNVLSETRNYYFNVIRFFL